ncbi:hypothetical protein C8R43DRAFT_1237684 [Mycena crocata]|nr:hypothetical protein C8R43DRAFT_1237684 [Mycena crocata]
MNKTTNANVLTHNGIDSWLEDSKGKRLELGAAVVNGNQINTVIEVDNVKSYCLKWRKNQNFASINAWCEIYRPAGKSGHVKTVCIANHHMADNDSRTQSRSSRGRLEPPLQKDAWLWQPRSLKGFVCLEIRRLRTPPEVVHRPDVDNPGSMVEVVEKTLLDDVEKPPYIIFRFEFIPKKPPQHTKTALAFLSGTKTRRSRRSKLEETRGISSELSELSDSESEREGPPLASASTNKRSQLSKSSEADPAPSKKRTSAQLLVDLDSAPEEDLDVILKKRKIILEKRAKITEAKETKRAQREKLRKAVREDTEAQAKRLEEEQIEAEQYEAEIQRMKAALNIE